MVSNKSIQDQLKKIGFNATAWNRSECVELAAIILPDENIFECVNGWYEGGVALLCATDIRILLVDKKPLKFLTVEDLRFDTINQIDYGHRLFDAHITISTGMKTLRFYSYNKPRLRKLIGHVQHRMAEVKIEQETHTQKQQEHLRQIDQQLQSYLVAQYQQQEAIRRQLDGTNTDVATITPNLIVSDMALGEETDISQKTQRDTSVAQKFSAYLKQKTPATFSVNGVSMDELHDEGVKEIFGDRLSFDSLQTNFDQPEPEPVSKPQIEIDLNPLRIAYSKLPRLLRDRQFGRASIQEFVSKPV